VAKSNNGHVTRRRWLKSTGVLGGATLAGCLGDGGNTPTETDGGNGGTPTSTTSGEESYTFGFAAMAAPSPWHQIWMRTHKWYAQDLGHEMLVTNAEFDLARQTNQVQSMINRGIDALIISPVSSGGAKQLVENTLEQGVPVMTNNSTVFSQQVPLFVAFGNYAGAYLAGKELAKRINDLYGGGRVIDIMGNQTSATAQQRSQGFTDAVEEEGLSVATHVAAKWSVEKAISKTTAFLQKDSDIQGIYGAWGSATEAARKALERQDMLVKRGEDGHVPIANIDATPVTLNNIRKGWADVSVDQPMPFYAPLTIHYLIQYLEGGNDPGVLPETGTEVAAEDLSFKPENPGGPEGHEKIWAEDYWAPGEVQPFTHEGTEYHRLFKLKPLAVTPENANADYLWANFVDLL